MKRKSMTTGDGVKLSYLEGGSGTPLVMVHGWSQSASLFSQQFQDFTTVRRVIALDWRGHGESAKPRSGYRICRFAKDLYEVVDSLEIDTFDILSHSLGTAALWAYLSMFGSQMPPRKMIFVDQPPALLARANWNSQEKLSAGAIIETLQVLADFTDTVRKNDTAQSHAEILRSMFTSSFPQDRLLDVASENLKFPRAYAAELLEDNCMQDWRALIRTIDHPTLVMAGEASPHPLQSQQWIADQNQNAQLDVMTEAEGGSHFMFLENPERFNRCVLSFLKE